MFISKVMIPQCPFRLAIYLFWIWSNSLRVFSSSAFSCYPFCTSLYETFSVVMRSTTRCYHCNLDWAFVCLRKVVVWPWLRDDFTEVESSNIRMHFQSAWLWVSSFHKRVYNGRIPMHLRVHLCKCLMDSGAGELQKVIQSQCSFETFFYFYLCRTCKTWGQWCVATFHYFLWKHDVTSQLSSSIFTTCVRCRIAKCFVWESFLRLWPAFW